MVQAVDKYDALPQPCLTGGLFSRHDKWRWLVHARFGNWEKVLSLGDPACPLTLDLMQGNACQASTPFRHYAYGMAHIASGGSVKATIVKLEKLSQQSGPCTVGNIEMDSMAAINCALSLELTARDRFARGDMRGAAAVLANVTALLDHQRYMEPPLSYYSHWDCLGHVLYLLGELDAASAAFSKSLIYMPRSGWALKGLELVHIAKGDGSAAEAFRSEYRSAWVHSDVELASACPQFDSIAPTARASRDGYAMKPSPLMTLVVTPPKSTADTPSSALDSPIAWLIGGALLLALGIAIRPARRRLDSNTSRGSATSESAPLQPT